jgi:hypothetical protein
MTGISPVAMSLDQHPVPMQVDQIPTKKTGEPAPTELSMKIWGVADLKGHILSFLNIDEAARLLPVCKPDMRSIWLTVFTSVKFHPKLSRQPVLQRTMAVSVITSAPLQALSLFQCSSINNQDIASLKDHKTLTALDLMGCKGISAGGFSPISTIKSLINLRVADTSFSDADAYSFKNHQALQKIDLYTCDIISPRGMRVFSSIQTLVELYAVCTKFRPRDGSLFKNGVVKI